MDTGARGSLRIYLGCAPGVGKTFAMLDEGHRRAERGTDVVVAYVETHGRERTARKLEGLPVVARRTVVHRGARFEELDLPAVLARRPGLALVDELAHTNAPGVEHDKRWQDVEALLEAGIDVISTVTCSTWSRSTTSCRPSPGCRSARPSRTRSSAPPSRSSSST